MVNKEINRKLLDWAEYIEQSQSMNGYSQSTIISRMVGGSLSFGGVFQSTVPRAVNFTNPAVVLNYTIVSDAFEYCYREDPKGCLSVVVGYHPDTKSLSVTKRAKMLDVSRRHYYNLLNRGEKCIGDRLTMHTFTHKIATN